MGTYDSQIALATRLIKKKGGPATFTRSIPGTPGTNDRPAVAPTKIVATCQAVILPFSTKLLMAESLKSGTLIQDSARIMYVAAGTIKYTVSGPGVFTGEFEPDTIDKVVLKGKTYTVTGNSPLAPDNGPAILHKVFVHT